MQHRRSGLSSRHPLRFQDTCFPLTSPSLLLTNNIKPRPWLRVAVTCKGNALPAHIRGCFLGWRDRGRCAGCRSTHAFPLCKVSRGTAESNRWTFSWPRSRLCVCSERHLLTWGELCRHSTRLRRLLLRECIECIEWSS